jgi:FixJ family two-component response regulator
LSNVPQVSIIDGNDSVAWAVAALIRSAGFEVEVFASAEEFIRSNQMPRTACLIVDVKLPGMSGLQLQSHLASAGRHIPIIFITASADNGTRALARELGAINVLDSPGDKALLNLLKEIRLVLQPRDRDGQTSFDGPGR